MYNIHMVNIWAFREITMLRTKKAGDYLPEPLIKIPVEMVDIFWCLAVHITQDLFLVLSLYLSSEEA